MRKFFQKDLLLLAAASTALLAWSSLPNFAGYAAQDEQFAFGGTYFDTGDYAVHVAMLRAGMQGAWGYNLRFTSEPHTTAFIRVFYILLGELNHLLQAPPEVIFQVARWILGYIALFSIYLLARRCFESVDPRWKWLAFSIAVLGAGVGWLQRMAGWVTSPITPIDYWLIDAYVLLSLSLFPHFALTLACMCVAFLSYLSYLRGGNYGRVVIVVLCGLVVQLVNPVAFIVVDVALVAATVVNRKSSGPAPTVGWIPLAIIAIAQLPLFLYNFYVLTGLPVWSQFTAQNQTPSPPPVYYLLGFAPFWPPAILGTILAFRRQSIMLLSSAAWVIAAFALAYLPVGIQRKFLLGVTIPFGLLATSGLAESLQFLSRRKAWISKRSPFARPSDRLCILHDYLHVLPCPRLLYASAAAGVLLPTQPDAAFDWIATNTRPDDLILSAARTGQLLAQKTGRRVFVGHEMETLHFPAKVQEGQSYYEGRTRLELAAGGSGPVGRFWAV